MPEATPAMPSIPAISDKLSPAELTREVLEIIATSIKPYIIEKMLKNQDMAEFAQETINNCNQDKIELLQWLINMYGGITEMYQELFFITKEEAAIMKAQIAQQDSVIAELKGELKKVKRSLDNMKNSNWKKGPLNIGEGI